MFSLEHIALLFLAGVPSIAGWRYQKLPDQSRGPQEAVAVGDLNGDMRGDFVFCGGSATQAYALINIGYYEDDTFGFSDPIPFGPSKAFTHCDVSYLPSSQSNVVLLAGPNLATLLNVTVSDCDHPSTCTISWSEVWSDPAPHDENACSFVSLQVDTSGDPKDPAIVFAANDRVAVFEPNEGVYPDEPTYSFVPAQPATVLAPGTIKSLPGFVVGTQEGQSGTMGAVYKTAKGYLFKELDNNIVPSGVQMADINGDFKEDIVASNFQPDSVYYLMGDELWKTSQKSLFKSINRGVSVGLGFLFEESEAPDAVVAMHDGSFTVLKNLGNDPVDNKFQGFEEQPLDSVLSVPPGCLVLDIKVVSLFMCRASVVVVTRCGGGNHLFTIDTCEIGGGGPASPVWPPAWAPAYYSPAASPSVGASSKWVEQTLPVTTESGGRYFSGIVPFDINEDTANDLLFCGGKNATSVTQPYLLINNGFDEETGQVVFSRPLVIGSPGVYSNCDIAWMPERQVYAVLLGGGTGQAAVLLSVAVSDCAFYAPGACDITWSEIWRDPNPQGNKDATFFRYRFRASPAIVLLSAASASVYEPTNGVYSSSIYTVNFDSGEEGSALAKGRIAGHAGFVVGSKGATTGSLIAVYRRLGGGYGYTEFDSDILPSSVTMVDLDGDNDPDVVAANFEAAPADQTYYLMGEELSDISRGVAFESQTPVQAVGAGPLFDDSDEALWDLAYGLTDGRITVLRNRGNAGKSGRFRGFDQVGAGASLSVPSDCTIRDLKIAKFWPCSTTIVVSAECSTSTGNHMFTQNVCDFDEWRDRLDDVTPSSPAWQPPSESPSNIPTLTPSLSRRPSGSPSSNPSSSPSSAPTGLPTIGPSATPSISPTLTAPPSLAPTLSTAPTVPSQPPSISPTSSLKPSISPTSMPSEGPTTSKRPSFHPSWNPTISQSPSSQPSIRPSRFPSVSPSFSPSETPSSSPSQEPSAGPSVSPSLRPSSTPSIAPSSSPSISPSRYPSGSPSSTPSDQPSSVPSDAPSLVPTPAPSPKPSSTPSSEPSAFPSGNPTSIPTQRPSLSFYPSDTPSTIPSISPSSIPTTSPSRPPTSGPTSSPSSSPTSPPSSVPSFRPTRHDESAFYIEGDWIELPPKGAPAEESTFKDWHFIAVVSGGTVFLVGLSWWFMGHLWPSPTQQLKAPKKNFVYETETNSSSSKESPRDPKKRPSTRSKNSSRTNFDTPSVNLSECYADSSVSSTRKPTPYKPSHIRRPSQETDNSYAFSDILGDAESANEYTSGPFNH